MCNEICCKIRPSYNFEGNKKAIYCLAHKKNEMVDVRNKRCFHEGCYYQPSYNFEGDKALYCLEHKLEKMVNVKNKPCIHEGCNILPSYIFKGESNKLFCSTHKKNGMVNVKIKPCIHEGCNIIPIFNVIGKPAKYCLTHKLEKMVDVKNQTCKNSWCSTRVQKQYDGYCVCCYIYLFPDKPVFRNYKTKEYSVVEFVKTAFQDLSWILDKRISDGCSKRRPDLFLELENQIIIIEVDENQHTDYDCSCQNKRIMELSQDVGHKPIVFIRFNPDDYEEHKTKISSCWGQDGTGLYVIKKTKRCEWTQRLNALKEQINYWTNPTNTTSKTIEIIQLFYDS